MEMEKKSYDGPDPNCTMSFLNKESPDVQSRKHELSLTLTPTTPFKNIFDETPTRFLHALESEMFQDLNSDNPFDVTFRKANSSGNAPHSFSIPDSSSLISSLPESEDLNTPSITLPSEPETPLIFKRHFPKTHLKTVIVPETQEENESTDTLPFTPSSSLISSLPESEDLNTPSITLPSEPETPLIFKRHFPKTHLKTVIVPETQEDNESTDTLPFTPASNSNMEEVTQCELTVENTNFEAIETSRIATFVTQEPESVKKTCAPKTNVVQTPVITSIGNYSIVKSNIGVPTAVVVNRPSANIVRNLAPAPTAVTEKAAEVKVEQPQAVVQSVCVTPMVQLMIRLPDGQTMPVQFPVMTQPTAAVSATVPATKPVQPATTVESQVQNPPSIAKIKLKEVLTLNQKVSCISKNTATNVKPRSKPIIQPYPPEDILSEFGISPPSSPIPVQKPGHNGRKRREPSDNPDEKRKRSLERNRAAATRCREKRKMWITALERKADELADTNAHLQHEVTLLRNEVTQLKTMLLAHKDCPVTLQQKGMSYEARKDPYTTVHIVTSSTDDVQRVPNCSMVSPLNGEFMEVEIGSVQSTSDASLTSDTSETSFKER